MIVGVIIARFQTPYLHEGHKYIIETVSRLHSQVVIILGLCSEIDNDRNPLDYCSREKMIKDTYRNVLVLPLHDQQSDQQWSLNLDKLLSETFPRSRFVLYGSRDSFRDHYSGIHNCSVIPPYGCYNATELRKSCETVVVDSPDFRKGIIYASANRNRKASNVVYIAIFGKENKLLLERTSEEWKLPSRITSDDDPTFEYAALSEVNNKLNLKVNFPIRYEGSFRIEGESMEGIASNVSTLFSTALTRDFTTRDLLSSNTAWFSLKCVEGMLKNGEVYKKQSILVSKILSSYKKNEV